MFFMQQDHHLSVKAAVLIAVAFSVCSTQSELSVQDELIQNHVTSPLIEGSDFKHVGDMTIFQGEYEEDEVPSRQERHVITGSFGKWPNGVVPYSISSQFTTSQRQVILDAIQHWEDNTCIDFRPKVATDVYSIYIMRDSGCYSFIGRISRRYQPQGVSLGNGCVYPGIVIHELGHAIGFYHEHTRPDRDQYIDVIYDNIANGFQDQFYKISPGESDTLGLSYDIYSIMHYEKNTFSSNGLDTIRPKAQNTGSFGNGHQLSALDIQKANKFYNCPSPSTPPPPTPVPCGGELKTASGSFQTPNFPETYPVNIDCEWKIELPDTTKLVEIKCEQDNYGIAGTYPSCTKDHLTFYDGHSKQDDSYGPYCHFTTPDTLKMTSNVAMAVFHAGPVHSSSRKGFKCTFQSVDAPTTSPPTTLPPTTPPPPTCVEELNTASGYFQTPNWPETYPVDIDCEWKIQLPDTTKLVEIKCEEDPYSIAGTYPSCTKDQLTFYDGHNKQDDSHGPYCQFTTPDTLKMSSNLAMAVFHAGPSHSPSRRGFKCTFQSVDAPTISPPTLPPPPPTTPSLCGGKVNTASGSFQTPNWPETYPVNINCEWTIELPDSSKLVELTCEQNNYGIAGTYPSCTKDRLTFYDGHSKQDDSYGPYCHFTTPDTLKMTSNLAMAVFHAGPVHSPSRRGFKCTFQSVDGPQQPTTSQPSTTAPPPSTTVLPPTTTSSTKITTASPPSVTSSSSPATPPSVTSPSTPSGGCPLQTLSQSSEGTYRCNAYVTHGMFFGLPGFPNNVSDSTPLDCDWRAITTYSSAQVRVTYMDLPGSTNCSTHSLTIYDGLTDSSTALAKLCGDICQEQTFKVSGSFVFIKLHMDTTGAFRGIQAVVEQA